MATLSQLQTDRAAAASAYLDAVAALRAAYIELAALDRAIPGPLRSFNSYLELPQHNEFVLPDWPSPGDRIFARLAELTA